MRYIVLFLLLTSCSMPLYQYADIYIRNDYGENIYIVLHINQKNYIDIELINNGFMIFSIMDSNKPFSNSLLPTYAPAGFRFGPRYTYNYGNMYIQNYSNIDMEIMSIDSKCNSKMLFKYKIQDLINKELEDDKKSKSYLTEDTYFFVLTKEGLKRYTYKTMPPSINKIDYDNSDTGLCYEKKSN